MESTGVPIQVNIREIVEKINFNFFSINNANSPTMFTDSKRALKELFNRYVFLVKKGI
jgi:hypothetical protein